MSFATAQKITENLVQVIDEMNQVFGPFNLSCFFIHFNDYSRIEINRTDANEGINLRIQQDCIIITYWMRSCTTQKYIVERSTLYLNKKTSLDQQCYPHILKLLR